MKNMYANAYVANAKPYRIRDSAFSTPQTNMDVWDNNVVIKAPKCTKYAIKAYNIFIFLVSVQYFKFSFIYMI